MRTIQGSGWGALAVIAARLTGEGVAFRAQLHQADEAWTITLTGY